MTYTCIDLVCHGYSGDDTGTLTLSVPPVCTSCHRDHGMGSLTGCYHGQISIVPYGRPLIVLYVMTLNENWGGLLVICSFSETESQNLLHSDLVRWSWIIQHGFRKLLPPKSFWGKEMDHNSLFTHLYEMFMRDKAGKLEGCFLGYLDRKRGSDTSAPWKCN